MESTQTDVVLDALVTYLTPALPGVDVVDGQPVAINTPDVLVIGWSPSRVAVEIVQDRTGMVKDRRSETLSIACVASVWRGSSHSISAADVRRAARELLDLIRDALRADRRLGGAVTRATLGFEGTLDQAQTKDGATATFDFTILVTTL